MLNYLLLKYVSWRSERQYPVFDSDKEMRDYLTSLASTHRILRQYSDNINSPFLEILDWTSNLISVHSFMDDLHKTSKKVFTDEEITKKINSGIRDMHLISRNLDCLISRQIQRKIEIEKKKYLFRKPMKEIINDCFEELNFSHLPYREWAIDSFERIGRLRNYMTIISMLKLKDFPMIDEGLYYAFVGYRMDRAEILNPSFGDDETSTN